MLKNKIILVVFVGIFSSFASAGGCDHLYPQQKILAPPQTRELCSSFFVNRYDTRNKAVILSSELLKTNTPVGQAVRVNLFRQDSRIPTSPKSTDYRNSGYQRGHMVPADDASSHKQMTDTFKMTNMTPQNASLNKGVWKSLENKIRKQFLAQKQDIHILTVAHYNKSGRVNGIPIPVGYWKAIYTNPPQFYYALNQSNSKIQASTQLDIDVYLAKSRLY